MPKLSAALLFIAVASTAPAQWKIASADSEPGRITGVVHRHLIIENSVSSERADVDLAVFSSKSFTLRVIDNPAGESLAEKIAGDEIVAGVNGGYFDPDFAPIGLRISDEKNVSPLRRARLISGVFLQSARGFQIVRASEFSPKQKAFTAIQAGPFLVDGGQRVRGLDDSRHARRTFAAIGTNDRAALGVCSEISLAELSGLLSSVRLSADFKIQRALNLDGGSSTAFWFARENGRAFSVSELKAVRDFVAIAPR